MLISNVYIKAFKSIYDLTFPCDPRITVLIGANESGKTNILKSIEAFKLEVPFTNLLTCQYSDYYYQGRCPEIALEISNLTNENRRELIKLSDAFKTAESFIIKREGPEPQDYRVMINQNELQIGDIRRLLDLLPRILFFDSIPLIKNRMDIHSLLNGREGCITERNLLKIGGLEDFEVIFEDSTRGRRASEEVARVITEQIRKVWSQEPTIEIKLSVNGRILYIDICDGTTVYDTPESRSLGFRWYLSFYINFIAQTYEGKANEYLFLIDEPGIHLHPAGQKDLVRVLEELAIKNQIIYTTHSPFMINRQQPQRVRLVSKDQEGTKVDLEAYRQDWRPLRRSIGLMVGDLFFFSDSGVIVELPFGAKFKKKISQLKFWKKTKKEPEKVKSTQ
ncbi:MAG: ATP-binding protein [candidate division KSB1 bacterium]|nr:ATP-binding protein [candidate division KSB1 bacterium]